MPVDDKLKIYREKRDFERTSEPAGSERDPSEQPQFVVQKHDASRLHYDFRIEVEGVLKSWAVPKGPSLDPRARRLAVPTEDHPFEYIDFEGTIPEGEYGGGTMLVWDTGTYRNLKPISMEEGLAKGRVEIWLDGHKLHGGFALIRTGKSGDDNWLLIKMKDEHADAERDILEAEPNSALTGRSLEDIAAGKK
ncbi:DNA polymerase ligase N-terminal domain-containing protein [Aggregatilinea lenta]|uniref:DNA polymerase ligase N-terminal domain-containing protein n=1 Tax=Aggregatilinea lenta TaxID=913108 RepID=UPI000E5B87B8|nr:DNA polymerase ligase N-terminal domain-containing protein [Aggregatilinea lenta]